MDQLTSTTAEHVKTDTLKTINHTYSHTLFPALLLRARKIQAGRHIWTSSALGQPQLLGVTLKFKDRDQLTAKHQPPGPLFLLRRDRKPCFPERFLIKHFTSVKQKNVLSLSKQEFAGYTYLGFYSFITEAWEI